MAIPCPIENPAKLGLFGWKEMKAKDLIHQPFKGFNGVDNSYYNKFKYPDGTPLKGHDGIDFKIPEGTMLFSVLEGKVRVKNDGLKGYGLHIKIRSHDKEILLAHLHKTFVKDGVFVRQFVPLCLSGGALDDPNRGNSEGPHLHFGMRKIETDPSVKDIFEQKVVNYDNGYFGWVDPYDDMIWWKGMGDSLQITL